MKESQKEIKIPQIPEEKLNEYILKRIEIIRASLSATKNVNIVEKEIAKNYDIPVGTQYYWKTKLRKIFSLPPRTSLLCVASHPQIRQALAYILTHRERSDKGTLLKGKNLVVVIDNQDTLIPLDQYLISTYLQEGMNASATYHALEKRFGNGQVLVLPNKIACTSEDLSRY